MENTNQISEEFKLQIETELEYCNAETTPIICSNLNNPENKARLVNTIAQTCLGGRISIAQAITQTEQLYSVNDID